MEEVTRFPLSWPQGWKRTPSNHQVSARFSKTETQYSHAISSSWTRRKQLTVYEGVKRVKDELRKLGVFVDSSTRVIVSSNVQVKLDGTPYSNRNEPTDHGVAVYWVMPDGKRKCMAIDRYDRVADNLGAIAATIAAMRAIERHGGAEILNRAFTGFTALPSPDQKKTWREIFGFKTGDTVTLKDVQMKYRQLAKDRHPDTGGNTELFSELNDAMGQARFDLSKDGTGG